MRAEKFVEAHRHHWQRLNELTDKAQRQRLAALTDDELHELGALYRRASADLARAQTRYTNTNVGRDLVRSLNDLVLRAHALVYSAPPRSTAAFDFILYDFPAAFRRRWRAVLVAAIFMYGPGLLAYIAVVYNSGLTPLFVPDHVVKQVQERAEKKITVGWGGNNDYSGLITSPQISTEIMTNNIRVTISAVALGVTAGLGTAYVLMVNGLLVGGLAGVATNANVDLLFWAVILPHGVIELSAICIAGGAGLVLARAIYAPGNLPRRDALRLAGTDASRLLVGVALMLVIAGGIEGFITPQPLPPMLKLAFALLTAVALALYLNLRKPTHGRRQRLRPVL